MSKSVERSFCLWILFQCGCQDVTSASSFLWQRGYELNERLLMIYSAVVTGGAKASVPFEAIEKVF
jgi:hypothetical protein